jgi:hypothetical protein
LILLPWLPLGHSFLSLFYLSPLSLSAYFYYCIRKNKIRGIRYCTTQYIFSCFFLSYLTYCIFATYIELLLFC